MSAECPIRGGSAQYAYDHHKCRCDVCRTANAAKSRRRREAKGGRNRTFTWSAEQSESQREVLATPDPKPVPTLTEAWRPPVAIAERLRRDEELFLAALLIDPHYVIDLAKAASAAAAEAVSGN